MTVKLKKRLKLFVNIAAAIFVLTAMTVTPVYADRIKDLASVAGVRDNQLVGYGLVVGLDGSGDQTSQTPFTVQSLSNMLSQFGITIPEGVNPQLKNVAAVSLHAELPPFAKPGQEIDVTVGSIGNAKSLRGGSLLMAPLRGSDGNVYAIAQGNLVVGGFGASGIDGSRVTVNIPSAGRIPNGATVERNAPSSFGSSDGIVLNLNSPDFTTATRLCASINEVLGPGTAKAEDAVSIHVAAPVAANQRTAFLSIIENIEVEPDDAGRKNYHQFANRHSSDRIARAGDAGGGRARIASCHNQRGAVREPAKPIRTW